MRTRVFRLWLSVPWLTGRPAARAEAFASLLPECCSSLLATHPAQVLLDTFKVLIRWSASGVVLIPVACGTDLWKPAILLGVLLGISLHDG